MSRLRVLVILGVVLTAALGGVFGTRLTAGSPESPDTAAPGASGTSHRPAAVSTAFPVGSGNPDLPGKVQRFGDGSPSPIPPGVDGCDRNYVAMSGERSVCIPSVAPGGGPVDCSFLRRVGYPPLVVVGTDEKHLGGAGKPAARGETVCAD